MTIWNSYGASVRGPAHVATGAPNQDAWASFHRAWGDGIVVSDGVGSKPLADVGSKAACRAGQLAARACRAGAFDRDRLLDDIRGHWLSCIAPFAPGDCAATCLFAFRLGDDVLHLGMLGDGLAAVVRSDGSVLSLADDKSQGFSNITAALGPATKSQEWRCLSLPAAQCVAVLLCTDGVADDLDDIDGFVKGIVEAHRGRAAISANRQVRAMLEYWPTPRHNDDKTIACLYRDESVDE